MDRVLLGFGGQAVNEGIGGGEQGGVGGWYGQAEGVGKAGLFLGDGARGAGEVLEVHPQGVEEDFQGGAAGGDLLADAGLAQGGLDGAEAREAFGGFAAGGEVGGVFVAKDEHAVNAVGAALFTAVHSSGFLMDFLHV